MNYFVKRPAPPTGNDPQAVWMRSLLAFLDTLTLRGVIGGRKINHPEGGFSLVIDPARGGAGGGSMNFHTAQMRLANHPTYLTCLLDGQTDIDASVLVWRPYELRGDVLSEYLDGVTVNYAYSTSPTTPWERRTATAAGFVTETQRIIPPYTRLGTDNTTLIPQSLLVAEISGQYYDLNIAARRWQTVPYVPTP